jgi:leucyl aminopeptidase (aminopeptidase T)
MSETQIAKKVINECLRIKEDEQLLINTWQHTLNLTNALALEAYKAGAVPMIALFTDNLFLNYVTQVPEEYYAKNPRALLSMLDKTDAVINIGGPEDPAILRKNPGEKMAKAFEADRAVSERIRERKIRNIFLPIGMLTPQRAQAYGFNLDHWRRVTNNALDVDHEKMSVLGKKLASQLEGASKASASA